MARQFGLSKSRISACALHPEGVTVDAVPDLNAALGITDRLLRDGHEGPIFEVTFSYDGILIWVDILERGDSDGGKMHEVKSSTRQGASQGRLGHAGRGRVSEAKPERPL